MSMTAGTKPGSEPENTTSSKKTSSETEPTSALRSVRSKRENTQEKGRRLLVEGRLRVAQVERDLIVAYCRGDSGGIYRLGYAQGRWDCDCPARSACAHLRALWLVTAVEKGSQ